MNIMTTYPRLLLASNSPRRRAFFELLGAPFEVIDASVDEQAIPGENPVEMVRRLSLSKARAVSATHKHIPTIGADTTVVLDGEILGKPADAADARRMLRALRARPHQVHTGVSIVAGEHEMTWSVTSTVHTRAYSESEISDYIASGDPFDKAGGYAIQHEAFHPVERIEGCYANVMGLPLCHLIAHLVDFLPDLSVDVPAACTALTGYPCSVCNLYRLW